MKRFETGKTYFVTGSNKQECITVKSRTSCFVTVTGIVSGRFRIADDNLFGLGENIAVCTVPGSPFKRLIFAENVV